MYPGPFPYFETDLTSFTVLKSLNRDTQDPFVPHHGALEICTSEAYEML